MTTPTASQPHAPATEPLNPTAEQRQAFIDAIAPRRDFEPYMVVSVPLIGAAGTHCYWSGAASQPGSLYIKLGASSIDFDMPSRHLGNVDVPQWLQRVGHWPWCFLGVPALAVAIAVALGWRAVFGERSWRICRPALRLMWLLLPGFMAHWMREREDAQRAKGERWQQAVERWQAESAADRARREAETEAEIERRVALRLEAMAA